MQPIEAIDYAAVYFFSNHRVEWLTQLMIAITRLGGLDLMAPLAAALAVALLVWRGRRTALLFAATALLAWGVCAATQLVVGRSRPEVAYPVVPRPTMPSFPSGHALDSVVVYGLFGLLLTHGMAPSWRRFALRFLCFLLPFAIGVSRLYLTVHFVSDVLVGWLGGLALVLIAVSLDEPGERLRDAP